MKAKAEVEAEGNSEVGNGQKGNSALFPISYSHSLRKRWTESFI